MQSSKISPHKPTVTLTLACHHAISDLARTPEPARICTQKPYQAPQKRDLWLPPQTKPLSLPEQSTSSGKQLKQARTLEFETLASTGKQSRATPPKPQLTAAVRGPVVHGSTRRDHPGGDARELRAIFVRTCNHARNGNQPSPLRRRTRGLRAAGAPGGRGSEVGSPPTRVEAAEPGEIWGEARWWSDRVGKRR